MIQLKAIAIWNDEGDQRTIELRPGALNIITGEAKTGKSALLEIVEFCLGRTTVSLPAGVVANAVAWYGLIAVAGDQSVFVGRPGPRPGQQSVSGAHLSVGGPGLEFPSFGDLEVNTNAEAVTRYLTALTGIGEYQNIPPTGATRPPLRPTIRHASLFSFQRQNEIANARQLFHRQDEEFMPQAIKDTLPYFLGAADREAPTLRSRLHELRREFRSAERRLYEARRLELRSPARSAALVGEAVDTGLISSPTDDDGHDTIALLRIVADAETEAITPADPSESEYLRLAERSKELTSEMRAIRDRTEILKRRAADHGDYQAELGEQIARLESLDILPQQLDGGSDCPVCGSDLHEPDPTVSQLREAAEVARAELADAVGTEPAREEALGELEERIAELRAELTDVHTSMAALAEDQERIAAFRDRATARAYVKGRVVQHLEQIEQVQETPIPDLESEVDRLAREIEQLEERLDPDNERNQVISRLNIIGDDMSQWARELRLEHAGGRTRIDASQLTVVVDTQNGPIPLDRMGSASNWVGYHLVAHLGLHKWFTQHDRPTPRFLMLDQPTQAFYPPDVNPEDATDISTEELTDDDRESVEAMFILMHQLVSELAPNLQLIVMDHANLPVNWFQESVVEVWRGGNKLVPPAWLTE